MWRLNDLIGSVLFLGTLIIWIMAYVAIRRKSVPGAKPFAALCVATSIYTLGYGMEIFSSHLFQVNFWSKIQYLGLPFLPTFWVLVAVDFCKIELAHRKKFYAFIFIMPMLTTFFRWTSDWWHLQYGAMKMVSNGYFNVLSFVRGPWYYIHYVFLIACALYAMKCYWQVHIRARGYLKKQATLLVVASVTPVAAIAFNTFMVTPLMLDGGPFFVFANYALFLIGIFRYNLMHLAPLARQKIFDWIQDGVIVFDLQLNVVDYNRVVAEIFPSLTKNTIGKDLQSVFEGYDDFMDIVVNWHQKLIDRSECEEFSSVQTGNFDLMLQDHLTFSERYFYGRFSELYDRDDLVGFSILMSDVTEYTKTLKMLEEAAQTDGLTRLMNRRYFIEQMERQMQDRRNYGHEVALIIFDIDHFKEINDRWGHLAGDHVLKEIAVRALKGLRENDLLGRYGGEEFIMFLPNTTLSEAAGVANRVRCLFEQEPVQWHHQPIEFTASFGLTTAVCEGSEELVFDKMVLNADQALYQAKKEGRNRVVCKH